jgi:beta-galactosidase/beta-glucuronidase
LELDRLARYPRPDLARAGTRSLEGRWSLEYDPDDAGESLGWHSAPAFSKRITVPFCLESEASGVADGNPPGAVWFAREFSIELPAPSAAPGRTLLHFGAVDYEATVWLNGRRLGEHAGGYTPFRFEIDEALQESNLLVVRVRDSRDTALPRGKQTLRKKAFFIFYPTVTGIWQPVWLELAGEIYLEGYRVSSDLESGEVLITCLIAGGEGDARVAVRALSPDGSEARAEVATTKRGRQAQVELRLDFGRLMPWTPESPSLYPLAFTVDSGSSRDEVEGYFGARTVEARQGEVWLNGEPLYQKLLLCQGYFPGGHYTPADPADLRRDVSLVKELGFNGLRMHQKVEDPRFLFWCDLLGCLVWEEMPSSYRFSRKMRQALEREWREVIERDFNHPSIITRVPFNESWGVGLFLLPVNLRRSTREYVKRVCRLTRQWDPTRPVVDNSGYDHTGQTDVVDVHQYLESLDRCEALYRELRDPGSARHSLLRVVKGAVPGKSTQNVFARGERYRGQPIIISEYGGFGFYKSGEGSSLVDDFRAFTELIRGQEHICGYCYTQFYDVYQEKNGLLDFARRHKAPPEEIRSVNEPDREAGD